MKTTAAFIMIGIISLPAMSRTVCSYDALGRYVCKEQGAFGQLSKTTTCVKDMLGQTVCTDNHGNRTVCRTDALGRQVCNSF